MKRTTSILRAMILALAIFCPLVAWGTETGLNTNTPSGESLVSKLLATCETLYQRNPDQKTFEVLQSREESSSEHLASAVSGDMDVSTTSEEKVLSALAQAVAVTSPEPVEFSRQIPTVDEAPGDPSQRHAYIVGAGIGGLAAAVFLVRDGGIPGSNIHVIEELPLYGGALDGCGNPQSGYIIRGGRMMNLATYECLWEMLKSIPTLKNPQVSVYQELEAFNKEYVSCSKSRLVDSDGKIMDFYKNGLSGKDRRALIKLSISSEKSLGNKTIAECFPSAFFKSNFWYMYSSMFSFQPWHSAVEMKRYMNRFMHLCDKLNTLQEIHRTPLNQYESFVLPIQKWLQDRGVRFINKVRVVDVDFVPGKGEKTVERLRYVENGQSKEFVLKKGDLAFFTNGSMTDASTGGSMSSPAKLLTTGTSFELWRKMAAKMPGLGNPGVFADNVQKTKWVSFTCTCQDKTFMDIEQKRSGSIFGTGGLVTLPYSGWGLSYVCARQPHFGNQPENVKIFWGYGLFPERLGDYVKKPMEECTGEEILIELFSHLKLQDQMPQLMQGIICLPCMMPFITSHFMPRLNSDRPPVVPPGATNFGFISQFCEIPEDVVFTVEYSVRAAQIAVYSLMKIDKPIPRIHPYWKNPKNVFKALKSFYK